MSTDHLSGATASVFPAVQGAEWTSIGCPSREPCHKGPHLSLGILLRLLSKTLTRVATKDARPELHFGNPAEMEMKMSRQSVLVVEDEPLIRLALSAVLEDEGYIVHEAGTVLQAIGVMARHHVDAIVTDIDMPGGLSGLDLVDLIAGLPTSRAIVVTSGRAAGVCDILPSKAVFIPKPYDLSSVVVELERLLPKRQVASTVLVVGR